ncbi:MAG: Asp-tRNA(Asn) amidotransferase subunit GatC [Methanosphaera stadtmanae]|jgi:aspartyl-tRNA(Asn)/glutamyl-tRNA(Gln) amidotransferase subunit C|nr:Asp-tRNA(Asn) amidotransferase subunit GatC [Methanosphaera stadtmanae]
MEIEKEAEEILNKFSKVLEEIPDQEETQYLVDNLNRMRIDENEESTPDKILRNAHIDKQRSVIAEKGKWTK